MARGNTQPKFKAAPRYIAGEGFRFDWMEDEVKQVIHHYDVFRAAGIKGLDIVPFVATEVNRKQVDVLILILDLGEKEYINRDGKGPKDFTLREGRQDQ